MPEGKISELCIQEFLKKTFLLTALAPDGKIKEKYGVGVTLSPLSKDGNIYLLFKADNTAFQREYLKEIQKQESIPCCCDFICFALQNKNKSKRKITICLGELKSGTHDYISKASKQILETRTGLDMGIKKCINEELIDKEWIKLINNITWQALIVNNSSMPSKYDRNCENYNNIVDKFNKVDCIKSKNIDLVKYINE